jgi:hypothetical protein
MPSGKSNFIMLESKIYHSFDSASSVLLSEVYLSLFANQLKTWTRFEEGLASLRYAQERSLQCDGYEVRLQYNPNRIQSTSAKIDVKSINDRKCFLCLDHQPIEQKGVLFKNEFILLCNPAPIFPHHGTIAHIKHLPQAIEEHLKAFLDLSKALSPQFTLFYNGPLCGASAPDHLHFQASPKGAIPIEQDILDKNRIERIATLSNVTLSTLNHYGRAILILEASDQSSLQKMIHQWISISKSIIPNSDEPLMNIICSYSLEKWTCIIIPRKKHRPDVYFHSGEEQVLVSPASVDMGGLIILPREKDFMKMTAKIIERIFCEVSLEQDLFDRILEKVCRS